MTDPIMALLPSYALSNLKVEGYGYDPVRACIGLGHKGVMES